MDTINLNNTGEWIALGSSALGQLLVWEWQSESFVMKQQSNYNSLTALAYTPDGQYIATGSDDGKIKIWNTSSGFCFVTFTEHSGSITALEFTKNGQVLMSSSLDGTVRAFDMIRYRNFRTFLSPEPNQFSCLAVDASGEIVCAGTRDNFDIYTWSVQTGKVLDVLAGHEGPVSCLAFSPNNDGILASGSWDFTIRTWDLFSRGHSTEAMRNTSEVMSLCFRPDGKEISCSLSSGQICQWDIENSVVIGQIEGRMDLAGGRKTEDRITAKTSGQNKSFTSIAYSSDGQCLLGCGNSKWICMYDTVNRVLIRKFQISRNLSLDGIQEFLNSRKMTEAGSIDMIDVSEDDSEHEAAKKATYLPGVRSKDHSKRTTRPEVRAFGVKFTSTGEAWAAAATEGLLIYSLDHTLQFDPFELDMDLTVDNTKATLKKGEYSLALQMALRLNDSELMRMCVHGVPKDQITLVAREIGTTIVLDRLLHVVGSEIEKSGRLEMCLIWAIELTKCYAGFARSSKSRAGLRVALRELKKEIEKARRGLMKM